MKKLLFGILIFVVSINSYSQDESATQKPSKFTRYGIKTALCLAHFHGTHSADVGQNSIYKNLAGFSGGYYMDAMGPSGHYSTQFGIQYAGMGTKVDVLNTKIRLHYVQLPLTFNFRAGYKFINVFCGGGIYGAGTFVAKSEYTDPLTGKAVTDEQILSLSSVEKKDLKPLQYFDSGLIYGGGLEFVLPNKHAIQVGLHFYRGFYHISNETAVTTDGNGNSVAYNSGTQNRAIMISLAYLVKGK